MTITGWWRFRASPGARSRSEQARRREARRFGRTLARHWLEGRESPVRALTPGAGDSFVAAAFRHGLIEGTSIRDAAEVAHAVLSGMAEEARRDLRHAPRRPVGEPCRDAAKRGVAWMAEQVLRGADPEYKLGTATIEKIRGWTVDSPEGSLPS